MSSRLFPLAAARDTPRGIPHIAAAWLDHAPALIGRLIFGTLVAWTTAASADGPLAGAWKGVYFTYPNLMTVEMTLGTSTDGEVSGVLKFSPAVDQRSAFGPPRHGSYKVAGRYDGASRSFVLKPGEWIDRPDLPGVTAPLAGVIDPQANRMGAVFQLPSPTAILFVLARDAGGDQLIADIKRSAYPPPPSEAQKFQEIEERRQKAMQQAIERVAASGQPDAAERMKKQMADRQQEQLDALQRTIDQMKSLKQPGLEKQIEQMQARLDAQKQALSAVNAGSASGGATASSQWSPPSAERLAAWASRLKTEYPKLDLRSTAMERIYGPSLNLFDDDCFRECFGTTYEKLDTAQRKAVVTVFTRNGQPLQEFSYLARPFGNVGDFGAPDVTVSIHWQSVLRAWLGDLVARFDSMPEELTSFDRLAAVDSAAQRELPRLWPSEAGKFATALAGTRRRIARPALDRSLKALESGPDNRETLGALAGWSKAHAAILAFIDEADRAAFQRRAEVKMDGVVANLMPAELGQVGALGSGLGAVESGGQWYARFSRDYAVGLDRPACREVLAAFNRRRPADFAAAAKEMIDIIQARSDKVPTEDLAETDRARLQFCNELGGLMAQWFAVPGDNENEAAARVHAVANQLGGASRNLLPPSWRAQVRFVATGEVAGHRAGTPRERQPVPNAVVELSTEKQDLDDEFLPVPIADPGFEIRTDVCWDIFHGRFDDIRRASGGRPGLGTQLSVAMGNINPQFHYAFISYVGIASQRYGEKQIGPSTTVFWRTTIIHPDGTRVEEDDEKYPVHIPIYFTKFYGDSYKVAEAAANGDGLFGDNPLGYLQTVGNLMKNGLLSQAGVRADGSFSIAQADWERPILDDLNRLFTVWPERSFGIWQFQENLRRFFWERKSLQAAFADARAHHRWTDLDIAARRDDRAEVEKLLRGGAKVNERTEQGLTALHMAALDGSSETVVELLKGGADLNAQDIIGRTPLRAAMFYGSIGTVTVLIAHHATLDLPDKFGETPLQEAADLGYQDVVKALLDAGADPSLPGENGMNALDHAAAGDSVGVLKLLMGRPGVNVQARTKAGWNALHFAAQKGARNAIGELIAGGIDVNSKTSEGYTPLHVAALNGMVNVFEALVLRGADLEARDAGGHRPVDLAIASNHEPAIRALRKLASGH